MRILSGCRVAGLAALLLCGLAATGSVVKAQGGKPEAKPKEEVVEVTGVVFRFRSRTIAGEVVTFAAVRLDDGTGVAISTAPSDNPRDGDHSGPLGRAYDSGARVTITYVKEDKHRVTGVEFPPK